MKLAVRNVGRKSAVAGMLVASLIAFSPRSALATTGPDQYLPPAKYKVSAKIAQLYTGQYIMKSVASGARLKGGAMGIEINNKGTLYGVSQFYGYDASGYQSTWVGTLYNFQPAAHSTMKIDILAPTGAPLLGTLSLSRSKQGDLSGQIALNKHTYTISWRKIAASRQ
jgi:hypothetical protein